MLRYLEEIRSKLLPSKVISRKVVLKQKSTFEYLGLCPFHKEKTPSFTVSDDKKFFHCFGCGESGDVIGFISKMDGLSYMDAAAKLATEAGIPIPKRTKESEAEHGVFKIYHQIYEFTCNYYHQMLFTKEGEMALEYLKKRGLTLETIKKFRLGYAPRNTADLESRLVNNFGRKQVVDSNVMLLSGRGEMYSLFRDRVMFPIINMRKQVIAFGGRAFGDVQPKYINSNDNPLFKKGAELYNLSFALEAKKRDEHLIVVEGYMDVISLYQAGIQTAVAPLGTAFKSTQLDLIWNYSHDPILMFDSDTAGRNAAKKSAYEALSHITHEKTLKVAELNGVKDPDEVIAKLGVSGVHHYINNATPLAQYIYNNEKALKPLNTPEQKSNLRKRLEALCTKIQDAELQRQYKDYFISQLFKERGGSKTKKAVNKDLNAAAILEVMNNPNDLGAKAILVVLKYPNLLKNNVILDELAHIDINDKKLGEIRDHLLYYSSTALNQEDGAERLHEDLTDKLSINMMSLIDLKIDDYDIKTIEDAKLYVIRLFKLNNLKQLEEEILRLSVAISEEPTEQSFTRLSNLKHAEEQLKIELGIL